MAQIPFNIGGEEIILDDITDVNELAKIYAMKELTQAINKLKSQMAVGK